MDGSYGGQLPRFDSMRTPKREELSPPSTSPPYTLIAPSTSMMTPMMTPMTPMMTQDSPLSSDSDSRHGMDGGGPSSTTSSGSAAGKKKASTSANSSTPYIPSYMDLTNGPEPCVVCTDAATGYHYRCMTCEGCKGFFRRTIQKNLQYHCKWNGNCVIDKSSRNQCQFCRFKKCVGVGMATDLVLNERQRVAKRKLIEDNRERRRGEQTSRVKTKHEMCDHDNVTDDDRNLIDDIVSAYELTSIKISKTYTIPNPEDVPQKMDGTDPDVWQQLAEVMTPSIVKVVEFAKRVPGFLQLNVDDQILLLKSCCMEIMCLRAACRYDAEANTLTLQNGLMLHKNQLTQGGLGLLVEPIFDFAVGLSKLQLDDTEVALLAAVLLMQSDRTGLQESEAVEKLQDAVLGAYKRYIAERRPSQPVHWAKILMKVTDLRTISTRHAERVLCIKLDAPGELPPLFLEMFDEGEKAKSAAAATPAAAQNE